MGGKSCMVLLATFSLCCIYLRIRRTDVRRVNGGLAAFRILGQPDVQIELPERIPSHAGNAGWGLKRGEKKARAGTDTRYRQAKEGVGFCKSYMQAHGSGDMHVGVLRAMRPNRLIATPALPHFIGSTLRFSFPDGPRDSEFECRQHSAKNGLAHDYVAPKPSHDWAFHGTDCFALHLIHAACHSYNIHTFSCNYGNIQD